MIGSGLTVGSTYIDIPVTIDSQLSPKQSHSTVASVDHEKATGDHSLGASITPSLPSGHKATPHAPSLGSPMTASNDFLKEKNDQSHST